MNRRVKLLFAVLAGGLVLLAALFVSRARPPEATAEKPPVSPINVATSEQPEPPREERPPPPPAFLGATPFPRKGQFEAVLPVPRRTLFVSPDAAAGGDGSQTRPWRNLQEAFYALEPGDRLFLLPGFYEGSFRVEPPCRAGSEEAPVQVVARPGAILRARGEAPALTVQRAFWSFQGITVEPGNASSGAGFVIAGPETHDILFDRGKLTGGRGPGIGIGSLSRRVTISNSEIHHFRGGGPTQSHGIEVDSKVRDLTIAGNTIHHNQGSGIFVAGPRGKGKGMESFIEGLTITGNTFHSDGMHGIKIRGGSRNVRIADNFFYDYRPYRNSRGAAILIYPNIRDVAVEGNHVVDSSIGILLGTTEPGTGVALEGPKNIAILRNYLECRLPGGSVGILVNSGQNVRIHNNVIESCADGMQILARPPGENISVANNLLLSVSRLAFLLADPATASYFDHNAFGPAGPTLRAQIGSQMQELSAYLADGGMPASRLVPGAALANRDLARVGGFSPVNKGRAFEEEEFEGAAPDIGVAEK